MSTSIDADPNGGFYSYDGDPFPGDSAPQDYAASDLLGFPGAQEAQQALKDSARFAIGSTAVMAGVLTAATYGVQLAVHAFRRHSH